jgi:hypothetical protein
MRLLALQIYEALKTGGKIPVPANSKRALRMEK